MRLKKGKNIILFCTGILILALSVLPHHHHCDGTLRFSIVERCDECTDKHAAATHHHPDTGDNCDLRQLFVMSGRDDGSHQHCLCHPSDDLHSPDLSLFTLLYDIAAAGLAPLPHNEGLRIKYPPFVAALYGIEAESATGLRAPPSFIA